jgi:hypothetical protein
MADFARPYAFFYRLNVKQTLGSAEMVTFSRQAALEELKSLKDEISSRYKVTGLELFGSFVRNEQRAESDIDVLVEFAEGADIFDLVGLSLFLEERLQRKVDVVPRNALRDELKNSVFAEAVAV